MKKSVITALISGNWGDILSPKRLPVKDREVGTALSDSVFNTPVNDNLTSQTYITAVAHPEITTGTLIVDIWFSQVGGKIFLEGMFHNNTASALQNTVLFEFKTSNYSPDDRENPLTSLPYLFAGVATDTDGNRVRFSLGKIDGVDKFKIDGQMTFKKSYFRIEYDQKQ